MDITGSFRTCDVGGRENGTGAFNDEYYSEWNSTSGSNTCWDKTESFKASRSWTGNTSDNGNHSHTITINNSGSSKPFSIMNPYISVNVWERVA